MVRTNQPNHHLKMLYETGVITSGEFALLDRFFTRMTRNMKVDLIV